MDYYKEWPILELLQDSYAPPVTRESLERLQEALDRRFPQEYADFLLQFNGGHFHRIVQFTIPDTDPSDPRGAFINNFWGDPRDGIDDHKGLLWWAEGMSEQISEEYLPIAHCNDRDQVVLKLVGPDSDFQGVWFRDGEAMYVSEEEQEYFWLADSFHDFLALLVYDVCRDEDEEDRESLPVFQAVERGGLTALDRYVAQGGDPNARNAKGQTLLAAAAWYSWPKIVRLLLAHGADPNARDNEGRTPLHHAATSSIDSTKLLLAAGADAKARDHAGKSVLAQWSYRADRILREHGAED